MRIIRDFSFPVFLAPWAETARAGGERLHPWRPAGAPCRMFNGVSNLAPAGAVPKSSFAGLLDAEDWRRAKAALSTALDPQGSGSLVGWDNPDSGNKGSFTPVGKSFPLEGGICRVFLAEVDCKGNEHAIRGTACSDERGEWAVAEAKPWKKT